MFVLRPSCSSSVVWFVPDTVSPRSRFCLRSYCEARISDARNMFDGMPTRTRCLFPMTVKPFLDVSDVHLRVAESEPR